MKALADDLSDLGEPVRDRTLVLNTLNGLFEKFVHLRSPILMQRSFPTFAELRSLLRPEEITTSPRSTGTTAVFLAGTSNSTNGKTTNPAHNTGFGASTQGNGGGNGNSKNRRRRGGGGGGGTGGGGGGNQAANNGGGGAKPGVGDAQPWPTPHNPWAGTIHMWPGPLGRGVLGPRPAGLPFAGAAVAGPIGAPPTQQWQAALAQLQGVLGQPAQQLASQPPTPMGFQQPMGWFASAPSQWDQASLAGSFNTTTLP